MPGAQHPQTADSRDGRDLIIAQETGNMVIAGSPYLTLTGDLSRRMTHADTKEIDLLNPYAMAIPMVGREQQLKQLRQWLESERVLSLRVLIGGAGSGKTRLALELCEALEHEGWDAGFLTDRELERFLSQQKFSGWGWQKATLIVVDHAAAKARRLRDWLQKLADHQGGAKNPLRMLLLERHADPSGGWWQEAFGTGRWDAGAVLALLDPPMPVPMEPLIAQEDREAVLTATLERVGSPLRPPSKGSDPDFDRKLASSSWGGEPLFLTMAALRAAQHGFARVLTLNRTDLALEIADNELVRIRKIAERFKIDPGFLSDMAAYVTLCQGLERQGLMACVAEEKVAWSRPSAGDPADVVDALHEALPGPLEDIGPVAPDMIGEGVILRVFSALGEDEGARCMERAFKHKPREVVATILRCAQDYAASGLTQPLGWLARLSESEAVELDGLRQIAADLPSSNLALVESAAKICELIVSKIRPLAAQEPDGFLPELAGGLNNLGVMLSALGRREAALAATEEAVEFYRRLSERRPDAYLPNLAASLSNLGVRLSALGQREAALAVSEEAADIYRRLSENRPDVFLSDLAMSLNNLSVMLSGLGRREAALKATEEAVEIRRRLSEGRPDAFLPDLASSLNNLGNRLSEFGRSKEALGAIEEAVEIYRHLSERRPDALLPELASSLNNLAATLSELGWREAALRAAEEAVEIRRRLSEERPDAFLPDLASGLNNLGAMLSELGRREKALRATEEAVAIRRRLSERRPDAFLPELARSLGLGSHILSGLGRNPEAFKAAHEALEILVPFVERYPGRYSGLALAVISDVVQSSKAAGEQPNMVLLKRVEQVVEQYRRTVRQDRRGPS